MDINILHRVEHAPFVVVGVQAVIVQAASAASPNIISQAGHVLHVQVVAQPATIAQPANSAWRDTILTLL